MSASTSGSKTTTGSVTLTKPATDTLTLVQVSGDYTVTTFVLEGTFDGTNWFAVAAIREDTGAVVTGTIAPADAATQAWKVPSEGLSGVRARVTAIASNTATFAMSSAAYVGLPFTSSSQISSLTGLTLSGDFTDQFAAYAASGAITQKSGIVYLTKAGIGAMTLADPTSGTDDGKRLLVIAATANAHTVDNSAGSGFNGGGASVDVATFGGAVGDNIYLTAKGGKWLIISKVNATLG